MFLASKKYFSLSVLRLAKKKAEASQPTKFLGRSSNNLFLGVVGLANVGKSTFFQAITKSDLGTAANYPYATIDTEESQVIVPSQKLDHLSKLFDSKKCIPSTLKIVDIAGLTRNAANGVGLGNKFLSDIRQVDGLFHVIRGFVDDDIIHIEDNVVDPVRDLQIVTDELILKDLEFIESGIELLEKEARKPNVDKAQNSIGLKVLNKVQDILYEGRKVSSCSWSDEEIDVLNSYNLLTAKPTVYLLNVSKDEYKSNFNKFREPVMEWISQNCPNDVLMMFSAKYESEISAAKGFEADSAFQPVIGAMNDALNLISFYTCGLEESRQWTLRNGSTILDAARTIHTDLMKTFIFANVYKFSDLGGLLSPFNEKVLKSNGKILKCGKEYRVEDGDVIFIKAGAGKTR